MPNRILKESICSSESLDKLTSNEEIFFYRLLVNCDDFGRFDARTAILKSRCFPLRSTPERTIPDSDIKLWLAALERENLAYVYCVDGKSYIQVTTWGKHQQLRAQKSKYPEPLLSPDSTRNQVIADDSKNSVEAKTANCNNLQGKSEPSMKSSDINSNHLLADSFEKRSAIENTNPNTNPNTNRNTALTDKNLKTVIKTFEDCGGVVASRSIADQLSDAEQEYGAEIVIAAFKKASDGGHAGVGILNYCRPIFEQYKAKGIPSNHSPSNAKNKPSEKVKGVIVHG